METRITFWLGKSVNRPVLVSFYFAFVVLFPSFELHSIWSFFARFWTVKSIVFNYVSFLPDNLKIFIKISVFVNVCPFGEPLLGEDNRPLTCTFGSNSCGPSHWCHLGLVPDEYQCCPGEPTNPGACQGLPEVEGEPGPPEAPPQSRWFYNSETRTCVQFIYNGRKGNQDNFLTQEDCEATCPGRV